MKVTKTKFEWDNEGWALSGTPAAGDRAILKQTEGGETKYKTAVTGYYTKGEKADLLLGGESYTLIETDAAGKELRRIRFRPKKAGRSLLLQAMRKTIRSMSSFPNWMQKAEAPFTASS